MNTEKENALDGRKEFDWMRELTLEDDTLPQKQAIVSTILAALSGLRTARAKYILKIVNGWIEDRSYVLVSKEAEVAYAPKVFLTKDSKSNILPKKLSDFTIGQTISLIDEVGEEDAYKMLTKVRTILEAAQEKDFAVSEALDIVYVMQSLTLQNERLQLKKQDMDEISKYKEFISLFNENGEEFLKLWIVERIDKETSQKELKALLHKKNEQGVWEIERYSAKILDAN